MVLTAALAMLAAFFSGAGANPPLVGGQEFIFEAAPFPSCHASTLLELQDGGILAAWFGGTDEGHRDVAIWAARRPPAGREWSAPRKVAQDAGAPSWNPVLFRERGGRIRLFYKVGPSPETWSGAYVLSTDEGQTFGRPEWLPAGLLGPIKNKPLLLPGGEVLCGSSVESYRAWTCWVERLSSDGKTWSKLGPIAVHGHPHGIIQPSLYPGDAPGEVFMLARSRGIGRVCRARSADGGLTWGPASPIELPNPNSGLDCVRLRDGRVLLVYNHSDSGRTPLSISLSLDLGAAWTPIAVLEDSPGEYSYPAVIQLSSGDVAVTYTWRRERIRFARIPLEAMERKSS